MTALRISGKKGAKPANSVLVPRLTCPATFTERASTFRCRATMTSVDGAGATASSAGASYRFAVPPQAHGPSGPGEYKSRSFPYPP
ncbi:hypothetical protein LIER_36132 [Lithospermum erythrorhizon]|uniref:Uncharacterized protein n=1 Tax=Lithospermum erythrorhizon TaxID=34254 RepID=A0AAV3P1F4_LITER